MNSCYEENDLGICPEAQLGHVNKTQWLLAMNQAAPDLSISYNLLKSALEVNEVGPLFLRSLFLKADI